jgi:hypothetical protein
MKRSRDKYNNRKDKRFLFKIAAAFLLVFTCTLGASPSNANNENVIDLGENGAQSAENFNNPFEEFQNAQENVQTQIDRITDLREGLSGNIQETLDNLDIQTNEQLKGILGDAQNAQDLVENILGNIVSQNPTTQQMADTLQAILDFFNFGGDMPDDVAQQVLQAIGADLGIQQQIVAANNGRIKYRRSAPPTTGACDINVMNLMRGRGAFEGQQDLVTAQILYVHDSVIELTCADQFAGIAAREAPRFFTGNDGWNMAKFPYSVGGGAGLMHMMLDPQSISALMESVVTKTLASYVENQFPQTFLGNTSPLDYTPSGNIPGSSYTCDMMQQLWNEVKCASFADASYFGPSGPFVSFEEMVLVGDPRVHWQACDNPGIVQADLNMLANEGFAYTGLYPATLPSNDTTTPGICNYALPPLPTGVVSTKVVAIDINGVSQIDEYDAHFCASPSCMYDYENGECVATVAPLP